MIRHVTSNVQKFEEMRAGLPELVLGMARLRLEEILSIDPKKILEAKARQAFGHQLGPFVMDHSALYFEQSDYQLPGCIIDVMLTVLGLEGICRTLDVHRKARSRTVLLYCDGKRFQYVEATIEGTVATEPRGANGFGWDAIFVPEGSDRTFAQMSQDEKQSRSSRKRACEALLARLASR